MKRTLLLPLTIALLGRLVWAQAPLLQSEPNRFLFLVDRSYSMARIDDQTRQAMFDMIYGGLNGQWLFGDQYAIWTFDEETHTHLFPLQYWDPQLNLSLASRAAKFLKSQPCHKQTRMDKALADARGVVRGVTNLNILLITDGGAPIQGTPFDAKINEVFHDRHKTLRRDKRPFVVLLAVRGGEMIEWAVRAAGEGLVLPPPLAAPAKAEAGSVVVAPPVAKPEAVKPAAESPAPVPKPAPVEPAPPAVVARTEPSPAPGVVLPAPPPVPRPKVEAPPPIPPPAPVPEVKPAVISPAADATGPVGSPAPVASTSAPPAEVTPTGVEATNTAPAARRVPVQQALAVTPDSFYSSRGLLFAGLGLLLVAAWLGVALFRRSHGTPQPSIITRSLDRKEK